MGFWDRRKKNLPVKIEKGEVEIVKDKNYEVDTGEYQVPPWAIISRITKKRIDALTDVVQAEGHFYNAVGERDKSLARLGTVLDDEITAEKAEARLRAMDAVEKVNAKEKDAKERREIGKLTLQVGKAKLEKELAGIKGETKKGEEEEESEFDKLKNRLKKRLEKDKIWDDYNTQKEIRKMVKDFKQKRVLETALEEVWNEHIQGKSENEWSEEDWEYYETLKAIFEARKD